MTIFFAIIAALALIGLGVAILLLRRRNMEYDWLQEDYVATLEINQTLRDNNRAASKSWRNERLRLWSEKRAAERHASDMQEFHLHNEFSLQHELAGAHALIELLLEMAPKGAFEIPHVSEVRRVFTPVIEMDQHRPRAKTNPHVF